MPSTIVAAKNVSFGRRPAMSETTKQSEDIANLAPMIPEDFIDIEVLRARSNLYADWLASGKEVPDSEEVTIAGVTKQRGISISPRNRRRFIELHAEKFETVGVNMIELPLRLKRKLCIEWNHLYRDWLRANPGTHYDFEKREFYQDILDRAPASA